ncbi:MAG: hypothetical protein A3F09_03095 [Chlamydiae bacterium RIFCSPHIGHO2_12_FULL_49_11]|nr:MAG: hypothetical protein A3F09_03095 [Chlamydiae bacterium RIFCSPHIGHO2_12_FULL_49_11]
MNGKIIIVAIMMLTATRGMCEEWGETYLNTEKSEEYSYQPGDKNQKKIAAGQVAWGILFFLATAVLCGFIADSSSSTSSSTAPTTSNVF